MGNRPAQTSKRLHAFIYGRVQGVNFRYYTAREANVLGLKGWVRNMPDGSVETVAEGDEDLLKAFLSFLGQGPPSARVEQVETQWGPASGEFKEFRIRPM